MKFSGIASQRDRIEEGFMNDKLKELEMEVFGVKFMNELLMAKLKITTEEIQLFAEKCLETFDENDQNTDFYYYLLGIAYQEKAAKMIHELQQRPE